MPRDPRGGRRPERRTPPPEDTGREQRYLGECRTSRRTLTVRMVDGAVYRGTLAAHTPRVLSLESSDGVVELRTARIRYVEDA